MDDCEKVLIVFDFDHTIVDGNTDTKIQDVLKDHGIKHSESIGWTEYMRLIFLEFQKAGVGRDAMSASLREMKLTPGMEGLWEFIRQNKRKLKVLIASDSNTWFIEVLLSHFQIRDLVDEIHTNPASWNDTNTLLHVERYANNTTCKRCPVNMCKSAITQLHGEDTYASLVYLGDGSNDLCPVLKLTSGDLVCPRAKYRLARLLSTKKDEMMCNIVPWSDAGTLVPLLERLLEGGRMGMGMGRSSSPEDDFMT